MGQPLLQFTEFLLIWVQKHYNPSPNWDTPKQK